MPPPPSPLTPVPILTPSDNIPPVNTQPPRPPSSTPPPTPAPPQKPTPPPTPSRPSQICADYKDIDFVGNDIANKPGKKFEDCCDVCNEHPGCTAYAWNDYNGGTCWLKSSVGHVIAKPGAHSSSIVQLWGPVCPFEYDTDFIGNDIGNKPAKDAGVCCSLCKENKDCKAYSWSNFNGGTCWMKSGKGKTAATAGVISAVLAGF